MSVPNQMNCSPIGDASCSIAPSAVRSSAKMVSIMPNNGSLFSSNSNSVIRIPLSSDGFLNTGESYLKMDICNPAVLPGGGNAVDYSIFLDGSSAAVINRIRVLSGPTCISDIQNYNVLTNLLIQTQGSDDFIRIMSICSGMPNYNNASGAVQNESITPTDATAANVPYVRANSVIPAGGSITVAIPLIASILQCNKYVPLQFLANSLTIEIYLETNFLDAFMTTGVQAGLTSYQVKNVSYQANIINILDDGVNSAMMNMLRTKGLMIKTDDWTSTLNSITANGSNSLTFTIADRSQNLKSLISVYKLPGTATTSGLNAYRLNTSGYYYRIGNVYYPNQKINVSPTNLVESFAEMTKCFNQNIFSLGNHTYADFSSFSNNGTAGGDTTRQGCFGMAVDLESFQNETESGMNTSALQTNINLLVDYAGGSVISSLITYSHKDSIIIIRPDGSVAVSC